MKTENISDLTLERYLLNELPNDRTREVEMLINTQPEIAQRINKIKLSNEKILTAFPEEIMSRKILEKYNSESSSSKKVIPFKRNQRNKILFSTLALAAAVGVFFIMPALKTSVYDITDITSGDITRIKGEEAKLYIYKKSGTSAELLKNKSKAKSGDLLQIAYSSIKDKYGVILSIDGRSTVTMHFPTDESGSQELTTGKKILLGNSYELDDAPGFEKFFFITSPSEIDIDNVKYSAELLAIDTENARTENITFINSDQKLSQFSILVIKE